MPISFTFPKDVAGLAGMFRPIRQQSDYVVPILDLGSLPRQLSSGAMAAAGNFTEAWQDRMDDALVTRIRGYQFSDQAGTLFLETSNDAATPSILTSLPTIANTLADTGWYNLGSQRYYRRRFVNGATAQTVFLLWGAYDVARGDENIGIRGILTDRSGAITTGSTSQQLAATNPQRRWFYFKNLSTGDLWLNFSSAATVGQPSIQIKATDPPLIMDRFVSTEPVNVIGATAGAAWVAKEG